MVDVPHGLNPQGARPTVSTPGLMNVTFSLVFRLDNQDNLGTSLHRFILIYHTTAFRKILKSHVDQHQVSAVGEKYTSLADAI